FAVARYNANGGLDNSFDGDGKVITDSGGPLDTLFDVAVRTDGKIVAAGDFLNPANGSFDIAVVRYNVNGSLDGSPLRATGGAGGGTDEVLAPEQVQPLLAEAVNRLLTQLGSPNELQTAGLDVGALDGVTIRIADLGGDLLGLTFGNTIWLDDNAAGWGWFVDPTPWDDSEFTTPGDQGEQGRMDLLSALAHELGHVLGNEHDEDGVMQETLATGTRTVLAGKSWTADDEAVLALFDVVASTSHRRKW
ncbi:MAG: hypothetical protein L0215_16165, partial [Gemmataceae bacterium]|nr:hypothetical protein [Gemmataceae bacterium]